MQTLKKIYSGYGIGFDRRSSFSFPNGGLGQNVLTIRKKTYQFLEEDQHKDQKVR